MFCLYMNEPSKIGCQYRSPTRGSWEAPMTRLFYGLSTGVALLAVSAGAAFAGDLPGKFDGVTIDAKLIGGQQYEALYTRIGEWEKATGAKVNILTKKNGFDIDKELKSDIASGSTNWCVG